MHLKGHEKKPRTRKRRIVVTGRHPSEMGCTLREFSGVGLGFGFWKADAAPSGRINFIGNDRRYKFFQILITKMLKH